MLCFQAALQSNLDFHDDKVMFPKVFANVIHLPMCMQGQVCLKMELQTRSLPCN